MNAEILEAIRQAVFAVRRRHDGLPTVADMHSRASRRALNSRSAS